MSHEIVLEKASLRKLNPDTIKENIARIIGRALAGNRSQQGWLLASKWAMPEPTIKGDGYIYRIELSFKKRKPGSESTDNEQFSHLVSMAAGASAATKWEIMDKDGKVMEIAEVDGPEKKVIEIGKLNTHVSNHFDQIFDRRPQIEIIHSAIVAFEESGRKNSFHTLLTSPPGSAKTEFLRAIKNMVGGDAVTEFDATSSTAAGIRRLMLDSEKYIPPILLVEEIEKVSDENCLKGLLSLLDSRQEVRGLNYRTGLVSKKRSVLCFATANDIKLFERVLSGSLASRFSNKIYCPRPSWEVMEKILIREVRKSNGKEEWIEPTIEYCRNINDTDPRRAITICLCGREKLLNGKYQKYLDATRIPE